MQCPECYKEWPVRGESSGGWPHLREQGSPRMQPGWVGEESQKTVFSCENLSGLSTSGIYWVPNASFYCICAARVFLSPLHVYRAGKIKRKLGGNIPFKESLGQSWKIKRRRRRNNFYEKWYFFITLKSSLNLRNLLLIKKAEFFKCLILPLICRPPGYKFPDVWSRFYLKCFPSKGIFCGTKMKPQLWRLLLEDPNR